MQKCEIYQLNKGEHVAKPRAVATHPYSKELLVCGGHGFHYRASKK
jgi:hypothetical protein